MSATCPMAPAAPVFGPGWRICDPGSRFHNLLYYNRFHNTTWPVARAAANSPRRGAAALSRSDSRPGDETPAGPGLAVCPLTGRRCLVAFDAASLGAAARPACVLETVTCIRHGFQAFPGDFPLAFLAATKSPLRDPDQCVVDFCKDLLFVLQQGQRDLFLVVV